MEAPITINLAITLTDSADPLVRLAFLELASSLRQVGGDLTVQEELARFIEEEDSVTRETILQFLKARNESDPKGMPKLADNSMGNLLDKIPAKRLRRGCLICGSASDQCRCPEHGYLRQGRWCLKRMDNKPREWEVSKSDLLALTADDQERINYLVRPRTVAFIEWLREAEQAA